MRSLPLAGALLALAPPALVLAPAASAQVSPSPGYEVAAFAGFDDLCGAFPAIASRPDGTFVVFDGQDVELRAPNGLVLRRYAAFPNYRFPSFVRVTDDGLTAVLGESSQGDVMSLDLATGTATTLANLPFNFDLAFDVLPDLAYVSAATGAFGTNSLWRLDLVTGQATELATITGFSGPLAVDEYGGVYLATIDTDFPADPDSTDLLYFSDATLDGGGFPLDESDAAVRSAGYDGASSMAYDLFGRQLFVMETNTGASGFGSALWRLDGFGNRQEVVATLDTFAGSLEHVDAGHGTELGPYQPAGAAASFVVDDCFTSGTLRRWSVRGDRPTGAFEGPSPGGSGPAAFVLSGGIPNGTARLVVARAQTFQAEDVVVDLGGLFPIALRSDWPNFLRQSPPLPLDASGAARVDFVQDPAFEGSLLAHWLVYDGTGTLVTSSTFAINRSPF